MNLPLGSRGRDYSSPPALPDSPASAFRASRQGHSFHAFSLVEVVIALGIISFGLLAVIGLMPVGLNTMRDAMDDTAEALIANQITGQALLTSFDELENSFDGTKFYFDDEGQPLDGENNFTRYRVITQIKDPTFPGSGTAPAPVADHLKILEVTIVSSAVANAKNAETNYFNVPIANSGKN